MMVPVIAAHDAMVEKSESYVRGSERTIYAAPPGGADTRFLSRSAARQLRRMLDGQHVGDIHSAAALPSLWVSESYRSHSRGRTTARCRFGSLSSGRDIFLSFVDSEEQVKEAARVASGWPA
jgi:hypothetical protein